MQVQQGPFEAIFQTQDEAQMELFKGAIHLLDGRLKISPLSDGFEPLGNAAANRNWLRDPFGAANDPAAAGDADSSADLASQTPTKTAA